MQSVIKFVDLDTMDLLLNSVHIVEQDGKMFARLCLCVQQILLP